jgi:hypothetical protein
MYHAFDSFRSSHAHPEEPMPAPQSYKNHTRYDPVFHFFLIPLLILNFAFSFALLFRHHHEHPHITIWWIVLSFVLFMMGGSVRGNALKLQNRIIRLEERLRLSVLLPHAEHATIYSLSGSQLIALRFASDEELPTLARRALAENFTPKQIKEAIVTWRPDHHRV